MPAAVQLLLTSCAVLLGIIALLHACAWVERRRHAHDGVHTAVRRTVYIPTPAPDKGAGCTGPFAEHLVMRVNTARTPPGKKHALVHALVDLQRYVYLTIQFEVPQRVLSAFDSGADELLAAFAQVGPDKLPPTEWLYVRLHPHTDASRRAVTELQSALKGLKFNVTLGGDCIVWRLDDSFTCQDLAPAPPEDQA